MQFYNSKKVVPVHFPEGSAVSIRHQRRTTPKYIPPSEKVVPSQKGGIRHVYSVTYTRTPKPQEV